MKTHATLDGTQTLTNKTLGSTKASILYPASDSTTAVQINKADGTTNVLNIDTTNGRVGIGNTAPGGKLQITVPNTEDWPVLGTAAGSLRLTGSTNAWGMYAGLKNSDGGGWLQVMRGDGATAYNLALQPAGGNVGIGTTEPTSVLHLRAGTATAGTAPLGFTSGTLLTVPVAGKVEFLTDDYYATITTSAVRKRFALIPSTASPSYTTSNVTEDRTYNANATTLDELADIVGTLIADLKNTNIIL